MFNSVAYSTRSVGNLSHVNKESVSLDQIIDGYLPCTSIREG
jgi:hypothetical protein